MTTNEQETWSYADLDLIADALYDAMDDYVGRAADELDENGQEAADEWTRKADRAEALFERVCRELDRLKGNCKHCGLRLNDGLHAEGPQRGKMTCALEPYGFNGEPVGAECERICNGSRGITPEASR